MYVRWGYNFRIYVKYHRSFVIFRNKNARFILYVHAYVNIYKRDLLLLRRRCHVILFSFLFFLLFLSFLVATYDSIRRRKSMYVRACVMCLYVYVLENSELLRSLEPFSLCRPHFTETAMLVVGAAAVAASATDATNECNSWISRTHGFALRGSHS